LFGPAMQVIVSLSLNSLSWKGVEREEEIGQSVFVWSEPIASPQDHGILVRETKGEKLKPMHFLFLILYTLYYSILFFTIPLNQQINFFIFINLELTINQVLMIKNVKCTLRQFPLVSLIHYTRCCFPSPYSSCRVLILLDSRFFSWKKHTHLC